jgi:hypothetical protein
MSVTAVSTKVLAFRNAALVLRSGGFVGAHLVNPA